MEPNGVFDKIQPYTGEPAFNAPAIQAELPAVMADAAVQREVAEVQASMMVAKRFPRNQVKAAERIMIACQRPGLAEGALYTYARGGTDISGPSIRLAEAIAQQWGNIQFGIRELEQRMGESTVEAYAWDLETNTRQIKVFQVKHMRHTRKGSYSLEDPRDIYEMVANQGARRLRACILGIIPGDVVESAVEQCEATLKAKADITPEATLKMLGAFEKYGVNKEMVEARIQRKLESITAAQVIALRKIYNSLKDGMSSVADWFEAPTAKPTEAPPEKKKPGRPKGPEPSQDKTSGVIRPDGSYQPHKAAEDTVGPQAITRETIAKIEALCKERGIDPDMIAFDYQVSRLDELTEPDGLKALEFYAKAD
jgi:hypothetical protein